MALNAEGILEQNNVLIECMYEMLDSSVTN